MACNPPTDLSATLARWAAECRRQFATDPELIMARDFVNTSPFYVHESRPAPLPACGTDSCRQGRGAPCGTGCAEVLSAQAEGARMAMGDQEPSEPMPLVILRRHMTDQEVGEMWANAACLVGAIAAVALFVHWLGGTL